MISPSKSLPPMIHYQPYGEQHPYEPLPCERFPSEPIAGNPLTIGIEIGHIPTVDVIWCIWQVEGDPKLYRMETEKRVSNETTYQWQAHLPAITSDEVIHYRLFVSCMGQQVESFVCFL